MLDIIRHWIPELKMTKNKSAFVATQCSFCPVVPKSKSFRLNTKLKVWKCYQCGKGGRKIKSFLKQVRIKKLKEMGYTYCSHSKKWIIMTPIDVSSGCESYKDALLPF